MRRVAVMLGLTFAVGIAFGVVGNQFLDAQQPPIQRTDLLTTEMPGMEGKEAHMWVAEIAPGAATGKHAHPTARFVYVIAGSVTSQIEGQSPQTFKAGEAFYEMPSVVHDLGNASTTEPAQALGFQIAGKGEPLQY